MLQQPPITNSILDGWLERLVQEINPVNVFYPGPAVDQGLATASKNSIKDFVDGIGTSKKATLILRHNKVANTTTYTLTTNETIPSNISFVVKHGAILDGAGTLTINGPFEADQSQHFGSSITISGLREFYAEWWGADPTTTNDSYAALTATISAMGTGDTLHLVGKYISTQELSLSGKTHIKIVGNGVEYTGIHGTGSNIRSVLSLLGANYIQLVDFEVYSGNPTNSPDAIMIMGRTSAASYGHHCLDRFQVRGYASEAALYSIASEENSFENVFVKLDGGGAKYSLYLSQGDDLSLGGFTTSTNLSIWFNHCRFTSASTDADAAVIYINGKASSGDIVFRDSFLMGSNGSGIRIYSNTGDHAFGPFIFSGLRCENGDSLDYGFYFDGDANTIIFRLCITDCNFTDPGTNFMYAADTITVSTGRFENNTSLTASSLYIGTLMFINEHYNNITFRSALNYSLAFTGGSGYTFSEGNNAVYNTIIDNGKLRHSVGTLSGNDATPSVASQNILLVSNAGATTITMFDDGVKGQSVKFIFTNANTTIDFTGTNLKGNVGVDWTPAQYDWMEAVFDGTTWYCSIHDCTA